MATAVGSAHPGRESPLIGPAARERLRTSLPRRTDDGPRSERSNKDRRHQGEAYSRSELKEPERFESELQVASLRLGSLIDFRAYLERQTARLAADPTYPPRLYVEQRMQGLSLLGREEGATGDALGTVREWLASPHGRFLVLLGDFGTGKTFLLH